MKPFDWIALVITGTVSLILVLAVVDPLVTGRTMSDDRARIVEGVLGSFVAILSGYMGFRMRGVGDK